jgi:Raf kinase inhibitor-like YbhB/YbcL family protein
MSLSITSPAFQAGAEIPTRFTCEGADRSPPLEWTGVPPGCRSLVLIIDDPDAPDPRSPRMIWVHWLLYNLPADATGLVEGVPPSKLPAGTHEGMTDSNRTGYGGPCPPIGRHRYFFRLYALDAALPDLGRATRAKLEQAMAGHVIDQAELMGTYQKRH